MQQRNQTHEELLHSSYLRVRLSLETLADARQTLIKSQHAVKCSQELLARNAKIFAALQSCCVGL